MAVIKIPSKHIYEMQNEKVIDNDIDKIEASAKTVVPDNHYDEAVFNENITATISSIATALEDVNVQYRIVQGGINPSISGRYTATSYCRMIPYYFSGNFSIPKRKDTKTLIRNIIYGKDENGEEQIKYQTECDILESEANATVIHEEGNDRITALSISSPYQTTTDSVVLAKELTETATVIVPTNAGADDQMTATAKVELVNDETNFQLTSEDNDNYYFSFKAFCGGEYLTLKNTGKNIDTWVDSLINIPVSGINTKYVPNSVTITVYGNTIGIDLQDNTITIGDGKNVISFQGNELMQTTNRPPIREDYQHVLDEWRNGKETATLRCGIADYYAEEIVPVTTEWAGGLNVAQVYSEDDQTVVAFTTAYSIQFGDDASVTMTCYRAGGTANTITLFVDKSQQGAGAEHGLYKAIYISGDSIPLVNDNFSFRYSSTKNDVQTKKWISPSDSNLPMSFHVGDIVRPYVFGADGKDRPMSIKKSGEPKNFEVLTKRIIYSGAVFQEIGLQEHIEKDTAEITIGGELSASEDFVYLEFSYVSGRQPVVGDKISLDGEIAEVTGTDEIRAYMSGSFRDAVGQTVTVEFE